MHPLQASLQIHLQLPLQSLANLPLLPLLASRLGPTGLLPRQLVLANPDVRQLPQPAPANLVAHLLQLHALVNPVARLRPALARIALVAHPCLVHVQIVPVVHLFPALVPVNPVALQHQVHVLVAQAPETGTQPAPVAHRFQVLAKLALVVPLLHPMRSLAGRRARPHHPLAP